MSTSIVKVHDAVVHTPSNAVQAKASSLCTNVEIPQWIILSAVLNL